MLIGKKRSRISKFGDWYSVTVSYRMVDRPIVTNRVGWGHTQNEALLDADSQLTDGTWRRVCVSNPTTIVSDMRGRAAKRLTQNAIRRSEGVVIRVEKRISIEILDEQTG